MAAQHSRGVHRADMVAIAAVNYFQAALVTDELVSGAYDVVPAAIYMAPEAITGSPLATASELGASVFGGFERGHFGNQAAESSALAGEHPAWETERISPRLAPGSHPSRIHSHNILTRHPCRNCKKRTTTHENSAGCRQLENERLGNAR